LARGGSCAGHRQLPGSVLVMDIVNDIVTFGDRPNFVVRDARPTLTLIAHFQDQRPEDSLQPTTSALARQCASRAAVVSCADGNNTIHGGGVEFMAEPSKEELLARIAELEKQAGSRKRGSLEFRVGEKGGVSVYGLGRFPVTLYYEQWVRLLDASTELRAFLEENKSHLKLKPKE
jgi:hypothetical protein